MRRWLPRPLTVAAVVGGFALTLGLSRVVWVVNDHSNQRLLQQQVQQAAAALSAALPAVQSHLLDATQVATATNADPAIFQRFVSRQLGTSSNVASISLWRIGDGSPHMIAVAGEPPLLTKLGDATTFFSSIHPSDKLFVGRILPGDPRRLGYAAMPLGDTTGLVVYAEQFLPATRAAKIPASSPFADLDFAIYLGSDENDSHLLESTVPTPITGHRAAAQVPFGDTTVMLVATAKKQLVGNLSASLWWIVLAFGVPLSIAFGLTLEYVGRRRIAAELLAAENERLYVEQRDIAGTLQHALLPELPALAGVEVAARYLAGADGLDVGGDWYDVIRRDDGHCLFFVGDVSGRGLHAATTMASLRFAIRAYVEQGDMIDDVLCKVGQLLDIERDNHFATVLAGDIDFDAKRVSVVSAGHFMPLLVTGDGVDFVSGDVAPPVGVGAAAPPARIDVDLPSAGTLLAFTDGVVERNGEHLDVGLDRLRTIAAAADRSRPLQETIDAVLSTISPDGFNDDAVLLGLRWGPHGLAGRLDPSASEFEKGER